MEGQALSGGLIHGVRKKTAIQVGQEVRGYLGLFKQLDKHTVPLILFQILSLTPLCSWRTSSPLASRWPEGWSFWPRGRSGP